MFSFFVKMDLDESRVEVSRDAQSVMLKASDLTVDILARVFKVKIAH